MENISEPWKQLFFFFIKYFVNGRVEARDKRSIKQHLFRQPRLAKAAFFPSLSKLRAASNGGIIRRTVQIKRRFDTFQGAIT